MNKRLISILILIAYIAILIKVMVFKDVPLVRVGSLMLNFGGADAGHAPNFVPFRTIVPYLLGYKGWIIAGINLLGNIALLLPIGFLVPLVCRNMTGKKSLILGVAAGLAIEVTQAVLRVGIFDIDDVILNALGVAVGYSAFVVLSKWVREKKYINVIIAAIACLALSGAALSALYPPGGQPVNSGAGAGTDLCGGTGGVGEIVTVGNGIFSLKRKDGSIQNVSLRAAAVIRTSAGPVPAADLNAGDRVTLIGDGNPDGSFAADTVLVCAAAESGMQTG